MIINNKKRGLLASQSHIEVSMTPLIDTLLVLLIVFMIATPFVHHAFQVALPTGAVNEHRDSRNDIFIAIDQYGKIHGKKYEKIDLKSIIKMTSQVLINAPHLAVVIYADKDSLYGQVAEVMDAFKEVGVRHVYCKTKKINT